jgi:hypothetical protein
MSSNIKKAKAKRPHSKRSLTDHYEEIGIKAVAAAVRFGTDKSSRQTRKEGRPHRIRGIGRGE